MKKQRIIIGIIAAVLILAGFVYIGLKNNIFADVNSDSEHLGNNRISIDVTHGNLDVFIRKIRDGGLIKYSGKPFGYSVTSGGTLVTKDFDSITVDSQSGGQKVLKLSNSAENVTFGLQLKSFEKYIVFEVVSLDAPNPQLIKKLDFSLAFTSFTCPDGGSDCYAYDYPSFATYCLSPNCLYNSPNSSKTLAFSINNIDNFSFIGSKVLLITASDNSSTLQFSQDVQSVKKDLGIDRESNFVPTFFATDDDFVYSEDNARQVAQKLNSFGFKRILIMFRGWQKSRGEWDLSPTNFPVGLKPIVDIFHQNGIDVGLHVLIASVSQSNPLFADANNIAKDSAGNPIHPSSDNNIYLINYFDQSVFNSYIENITTNLAENNIDFVFLDGSEWLGLGAADSNIQRAINNRCIEKFAQSSKIEFQVSAWGGIYAESSVLLDTAKIGTDLKYWVDHTTYNASVKLSESARVAMALRRKSLQIPNFGWISLNTAWSESDYAYALSAAVANGAPLTMETRLGNFLTNPDVDKYQSTFKERLGLFNSFSSRSVQVDPLVVTQPERYVQFENNILGVTLPKDLTDGYKLKAGENRKIFINPWVETRAKVIVEFTGLKSGISYTLTSSNLLQSIVIKSDNSGNGQAYIDVDSAKNDYILLTLTEPSLTSTPLPSETATASPLSRKTATTVPSPSSSETPSSTPTPVPSKTVTAISYTLPKGFSTLSVTKSSPTTPLTSAGLTVYKFDTANNKWLKAPGDSFTLTPLQAYYVYNPLTTKIISLPTGSADTGPYVLTKGWNLLSTQSAKQRSQIQLNINKQTKSATDWITQKTINDKIFIIDNTMVSDPCFYFSLLDVTDQVVNCAKNSLKKQKTIPAGKAFWVYVK